MYHYITSHHITSHHRVRSQHTVTLSRSVATASCTKEAKLKPSPLFLIIRDEARWRSEVGSEAYEGRGRGRGRGGVRCKERGGGGEGGGRGGMRCDDVIR